MTYFNPKSDRFFLYFSPKLKIMADKIKAKKISIKYSKKWIMINLLIISITIVK